ncbi:MAG: YdcF family protein [Anaerolineae bacterium]|nr:YdcF family protein [Anaerolineae bacterium]
MKENDPKQRGCLLRPGCLVLSGTAGSILTVFLLLFGIEIMLTILGGILIIADPLRQADAAVVLSGGGLGRLEEAARLYEQKYVDWIILTETGKTSPDFGLFSDIDKFELIRLGIPPDQIIITEQHVDDTRDEARVVKKVAQSRNFHSLLVITDPFHSLRTRIIFRDRFRGSDITVYIRPVQGHWYRSSTWWTSRQGWETTLGEYARLFAYFTESRLR